MGLSDDALVTLNEVKQFYFSDSSNSKTQDDDLIEELINRISTQFSNYCNLDSFKAKDYIEYCDVDNHCLYTKNIPINSIDSINRDSEWNWTDDTIIDPTSYRIFGDRYILFKYIYKQDLKSLKIEYNGGYNIIPDDLKHACIKEVVREYKHRKDFDVRSGTKSESGSDESNTYIDNGLMRSTKEILGRYKRLLY